jgi:ABC-2 type transport system ATP-binding protein
MSGGSIMRVDAPNVLKESMHREVLEIVCQPVREAFKILKGIPGLAEVQAFGDRLNVIVDRASAPTENLTRKLTGLGIKISGVRSVSPSLENVFISLLSHQKEQQ